MKTAIYEILYDRLPIELVDIIKDYYNDLQRKTLLNCLFSRFTKYEMWRTTGWDGLPIYHSKKYFSDGYTAQIITVHLMWHPYQKSQRFQHYIEKRLITGPGHNQLPVLVGTMPHAMDKRNRLIFDLKHYDKSEIINHCFQNDIKVYKSWNKSRLITALLKC
ncbi:MAG: hypothetical protein ACPHF2_02210 [Crocinitomicaceae bacterium]